MSNIRQVYFYVVTLVGLLMMIFPTADLINQALKTWVFPQIEQAEYAHYPRMVAPPEATKEGATAPAETSEQQEKRLAEEKEFSKIQRRAQKQRDIVRDISFLIVGIPLFAFHFRVVQKEKSKD